MSEKESGVNKKTDALSLNRLIVYGIVLLIGGGVIGGLIGRITAPAPKMDAQERRLKLRK